MENALDQALQKILSAPYIDLEGFTPETTADAVAFKIVWKALDGDGKCLQMVADRTGGRAALRESGGGVNEDFVRALYENLRGEG